MKHWWKILCVMLLLYVLTIGMLAPLNVGITATTPSSAKMGEQFAMTVTGYNTSFTEAKEPIRAWLEIETAEDSAGFSVKKYYSICSDAIKILDDQHLEVAFTVPNQLPDSTDKTYASLLINSDNDGSAISPDAIAVSKDSVEKSAVARQWGDCPAENLFTNAEYDFPFRTILYESIRNLYFHVPMWFGMILIFMASVFYSSRYLRKKNPIDDIRAKSYATVGLLFGILGIITGGIWAKYTWGAFWSFDVKQNMSAICLLIYMAYFVLRGSFDDFEKRARIGAVYNIFAFATLIPLLFVIPRLAESLHPGNGGNPGFGGDDLDNTMRTVFYPAVIGWTLLGFWIGQLLHRANTLKWKRFEDDDF